jgi:hypothetical protein
MKRYEIIDKKLILCQDDGLILVESLEDKYG